MGRVATMVGLEHKSNMYGLRYSPKTQENANGYQNRIVMYNISMQRKRIFGLDLTLVL
jgi:hypothetical protein